MPESESVRANINAPMIARPIETSYETICALERKAPSKAYFEFDDQPARINASTPTLDTASTNKITMLTSAMTAQSAPNCMNGQMTEFTICSLKNFSNWLSTRFSGANSAIVAISSFRLRVLRVSVVILSIENIHQGDTDSTEFTYQSLPKQYPTPR